MANTYDLPEVFDEKTGKQNYPIIAIHSAMSGFKPVIYWWNPEGFPEPYDSWHVGYEFKDTAIAVAKEWSKESGIPFAGK